MGKLVELRQKIGAVENIQTITRTLATVAGAKLSRTRRRAAGLRAYARSIREMVFNQQAYMARTGLHIGALSSLLRQREPVRNIVLLVITADRGMCGGYNLEACRFGSAFWDQCKKADQAVGFILKGRKGAEYFKRRQGEILHQERWGQGGIGWDEVERLLDVLLSRYRSGEADAVYAVYTEFYSPIHRRPRTVRMLPVELPEGLGEEEAVEEIGKWYYEPALAEMIDELLAVYLRVQLCDMLLESYASEQGARMITMEEATERAETTLQEYRVQHNRLRREAITTDLLGMLFASKAIEAAASPPARRG